MFQVTKDYVQGLDHRITVLEAAAKRAQLPGHVKRPVPVVAAPRPKPLPADLNTAEAQVYRQPPPKGPVVGPLAPDGGP